MLRVRSLFSPGGAAEAAD